MVSQITIRNLLDNTELEQRESGVSQPNIIITCLQLIFFFKMSFLNGKVILFLEHIPLKMDKLLYFNLNNSHFFS